MGFYSSSIELKQPHRSHMNYLNLSIQSRVAAFDLALSMTLAVLVSVAGLAHVEPVQTLASAVAATSA